jgi:hypothetical protein
VIVTWTAWLVVLVISFAIFEGYALKTGNTTLSRYVWTISAHFPPFGWICGIIVGFLGCHFWWGGAVCFAPVQ